MTFTGLLPALLVAGGVLSARARQDYHSVMQLFRGRRRRKICRRRSRKQQRSI